MRGAHADRPVVTDQQRIIPADAGSTARYVAEHRHLTDHPRGCGEHFPDCLLKT